MMFLLRRAGQWEARRQFLSSLSPSLLRILCKFSSHPLNFDMNVAPFMNFLPGARSGLRSLAMVLCRCYKIFSAPKLLFNNVRMLADTKKMKMCYRLHCISKFERATTLWENLLKIYPRQQFNLPELNLMTSPLWKYAIRYIRIISL
jgi:hypothetical protein